MISTFSCFLRSIYWWYSSPFSSTNNCISGFATKTKILSEMALTIKSSALTGRIVPFFISSCSDRSSRLIANRKLGNKVLRQISFPHSLVRISLYINKGSSGLAVKRSKCASMKHFIFSKKRQWLIYTRKKCIGQLPGFFFKYFVEQILFCTEIIMQHGMGYTSLLSYFCCFASGESSSKYFLQLSYDCSVLLVSSFILSFLFNRIVSKRKCIRNYWKQQTDEIKKCAFCSYEMFFSRKANLFFEAG